MNKRKPLSARQQQILEFIIDQIQTRGFAPTVREIVSHVGDRSPTSVHRHLKTLEDRGHIIREANKSRSVRLTAEHRGLAISGTITPGTAIQPGNEHDRVDLAELYDTNNHFTLSVGGSGLAADHINEGDLVVVRRQSSCADGDVVVVILEDQTVAVKRYRAEATRVRFESISSDKNPTYGRKGSFEIQGVVVGVLRRFDASPAV